MSSLGHSRQKPIKSEDNVIKARVLVTNDDGISAPGIELLYEAACSVFSDVWVVAPASEQSGKGHSLTLQSVLEVFNTSEKIYSVAGTPTDCMILALNEIMRNSPPDLVLSGVNNGYNLCEDITYSGTIGAAIEATIAGIPAIAFSQETKEAGKIDIELSKKLIKKIIGKLINYKWPEATLFNVNFPYRYAPNFNIKITKQGKMKLGDDIILQNQTNDTFVYKIGKMFRSDVLGSQTDISAIRSGHVSITALTIDLTNYKELDNLKTLFKD